MTKAHMNTKHGWDRKLLLMLITALALYISINILDLMDFVPMSQIVYFSIVLFLPFVIELMELNNGKR